VSGCGFALAQAGHAGFQVGAHDNRRWRITRSHRVGLWRRPQRIAIWVNQRVDFHVHIQIRPVQMMTVEQLYVVDLAYRGVKEPGVFLMRKHEFSTEDPYPHALRRDVFDLNVNRNVAAKLLRATPGATLVAAFGDNSFDVEMMKQSAVAIAVRPKPRLLERASELPDLIDLIAE
jgi:hypothetical protein